jgi:hypothetical protein
MGYDDLKQKLVDYSQKIKSGAATVADHSEIKNHINDAYGAGSIPQELKTDLGKKATFAFKNRNASKGLLDLPEKVVEKGGTLGSFIEKEAPEIGKVVSSAAESGGLRRGLKSFAPLLGVLGHALPIAGAAYGLSQGDAFAADPTGMLQTDELGKGSDKIEKPVMTQSPMQNAAYSGEQLKNKLQESPAKELLPGEPADEVARYSDLQNLLNKVKPVKKF